VTPAPGTADGFTVYSHAGDDWRECKDFVRSRLGADHKPAMPIHGTLQREVPDRSDRKREAARIWRTSFKLAGSPAQAYLERRLKGRSLPPAVLGGGALRWNPEERRGGAIGAMIALMTDPKTGKPTGIHRTYITPSLDNVRSPDGRSMRLMLGPKGVVRLWPDEEVSTSLSIGEGIETVIAGAIELGRAPAWAALDAGNLERFPVLSGIEGLTIFVDHDVSGTGQGAARTCALRWFEATGIKANLVTPTQPGDLNDVLKGEVA
tara:strand:+ start:47 stop:838 length:792 start_codon:yes stop_codon:yes gene_type:complete